MPGAEVRCSSVLFHCTPGDEGLAAFPTSAPNYSQVSASGFPSCVCRSDQEAVYGSLAAPGGKEGGHRTAGRNELGRMNLNGLAMLPAATSVSFGSSRWAFAERWVTHREMQALGIRGWSLFASGSSTSAPEALGRLSGVPGC